MPIQHGDEPASPWIQRWSHLVPEQGTVLDVACGHGRHLRWFAGRQHPVVGIDRSQQAIETLLDLQEAGQAQLVLVDMENRPWPVLQDGRPRQFDAVVVTNYLWRPLLPTILHSVAPGGALLYETFAEGNASVGRPSRPDFLLMPGELLRVCSGLRIVAYEDGFCEQPERFVQRVAAVRPPGDQSVDATKPGLPTRYRL